MTGYVGTKFAESYGIVVDFVDPELTELVRVRIPLLDCIPAAAALALRMNCGLIFCSLLFVLLRSMPASTVIFPFVRPNADMPVSDCLKTFWWLWICRILVYYPEFMTSVCSKWNCTLYLYSSR